MKKLNPRYPFSGALTEDYANRVETLRDKGWKISDIFKLGIDMAERKEKKR